MTHDLDAEIMQEKRLPPRPLSDLGGVLYGPPEAPSRWAYIAWLDRADPLRALDKAKTAAREDQATTLWVGGPPGNYVYAGVAETDTAARETYASLGFRERERCVDLTVIPSDSAVSPDVFRVPCRDTANVVEWIADVFARGWAHEAQRAANHDALFVARDRNGQFTGFAAHSGNNVAWGTFGPVGVISSARGAGLGQRLSLAALSDLHHRGHERVTVPWVAASTVPFYARMVAVVGEVLRIRYALDLTAG